MHITSAMKPGRLWLHSHQEYPDPLNSSINGNAKESHPLLSKEKSSEDESDSQSKTSDSESIKFQSERLEIPPEYSGNNFRCSLIIRKESLKDLIDKKVSVANKENHINSETRKNDTSIERSSSVIILRGQTPVDPSKPQGQQPLNLTTLLQESLTLESCGSSLDSQSNPGSSRDSHILKDIKSTQDTNAHDDLKRPKTSQKLKKCINPETHDDIPVRQASQATSGVKTQEESMVTKFEDTLSPASQNSLEIITLKDKKLSKDTGWPRSPSPEEHALIQISSTPKCKLQLPSQISPSPSNTLAFQGCPLPINQKLTQDFRSLENPQSSSKEKSPLSPQAQNDSNKLSIRRCSVQESELPQKFLLCLDPHSHQTSQSPKNFQKHYEPAEHEDNQSSKNREGSQDLEVSKDPESVHNHLMTHDLMKDTEIPNERTMVSIRHYENGSLAKKRRILEPTEYHDNCPTEYPSNPIKINAGNEDIGKISEKLDYNVSLKAISNKEKGEPCDRNCVYEPKKTSNEPLNNHSNVVIAEEQKVPSPDHNDSLSSELTFIAETEATVESNSSKEHRQLETRPIKTSDFSSNEIDVLEENGTPEQTEQQRNKSPLLNEDEQSEIEITEQGESQDILAKACLAVGLDVEEFMCFSDPYDETSQHDMPTPKNVNDNNRFLYPNTQWDQSECQPLQNSHLVIKDDRCPRIRENLYFEKNIVQETELSKKSNMNSIRYSVPHRYPYRMPYAVPANCYPHPVDARFRPASFHPNYPYSDSFYYNYQFPRNIPPSHPAFYAHHLVNTQKYQPAEPLKAYPPYNRYPYLGQSGKINPSLCYPNDSGIVMDTYKSFNTESKVKPNSLPQQYNDFAALESSHLQNKGPVGFSQPKIKPMTGPSMLPANNASKSQTTCYSPIRSPITPAIFSQPPSSQQSPCTMSYENGRQALNPNSHMFYQPFRNAYPHAALQETSKEYCSPSVNYAHQLAPRSLPTFPSAIRFPSETISNCNKNFTNNSTNVQNSYYNYPSIENSYSQEVSQGHYTSIPFRTVLPEESEYYLSRNAPQNQSSYIPQHPKRKNAPKFSSYYPIHHKYGSNQIYNRKELNKNNLSKESYPYVSNYAGPFTIEQLQNERHPFPYSYTDWKVPTASQVEGHKIEKMRNPNYTAYQEENVVKPLESPTTLPQHDMQAREADASSVNISNHKSGMQRQMNISDHHMSAGYGAPRVAHASATHVTGYQPGVSLKQSSDSFEHKSGHVTLSPSVIHHHHNPGHLPSVCNSNHFDSRTALASSVNMEASNHLPSNNNNSVISHTINQTPLLNSAKQCTVSTVASSDRTHPISSQVPTTSGSPNFSSLITSSSTPASRQLPSCRYQKSPVCSVDTVSTQDWSCNISESSSANELTSPYMSSSLLSSHTSELYDSTNFSPQNNCQQPNDIYHSGMSNTNIIKEKQNPPSLNEHSNSKSINSSCAGRPVYSSNHPRPSSEPTWSPCEKGHMPYSQNRHRSRPLSLPNQISIGSFILNKGFATFSLAEKEEDEDEIFIFEQKFLPVIDHLLGIPEAANLRPYRDNPDELLIHLVQLWGGKGAQSKLEEKYQRMKDNFMSVVKYLFEPHLLSIWGWDKAAPEQILDELIQPSDQGSLPRVVYAGRLTRHVSSKASLESASDFLEDDVFLPASDSQPGESMPDVFDCLDDIDHSSKYDPLLNYKGVKYLSMRKASDIITTEVGSNHLKSVTSSDDIITRTEVCRGSDFDNEYTEYFPINTAQEIDQRHFSNGESAHIRSETSISSSHGKEAGHINANQAELGNEICRANFTNTKNEISPKRVTMKRPSSFEGDADQLIKKQKLPSFKDVDVFPVEKTVHSMANEKCFNSMCLIGESDKLPDVSIFKLDYVNKHCIPPDKEPLIISRSREPDCILKNMAMQNVEEPRTQIERATFEYSHYADASSSNHFGSFVPKTLEINNSEVKSINIKMNNMESTSNPRDFSFNALDDHISKLVENNSKFSYLKDEKSVSEATDVESQSPTDKTNVSIKEDFELSTVTSDEVVSSSRNISLVKSTSTAPKASDLSFDWEELTKHLLQYKETLANKHNTVKNEVQQYVNEFRSNDNLQALDALISDECATVVKNDSVYEQQDVNDSSTNANDESDHPCNEVSDLSMNKADLKIENSVSDDSAHVHDRGDSVNPSEKFVNQTFINQTREIKIITEWESHQSPCSNDAIINTLDNHGNTLKDLHEEIDSTYTDDNMEMQVKTTETLKSALKKQSVPDEFKNKNSDNIVNDQPSNYKSNLFTKINDGKSNVSCAISNSQQHLNQTSVGGTKPTPSNVSGSDFLSKIRTTKKNNTSCPINGFEGTTRDYNAIFQKYIEKKLLSDQYGREGSDVISSDSLNVK